MLSRGMVREFKARMKFYAQHNHLLCMVARPPENRRGHFKKASNMNYCLKVATGVTRIMHERHIKPSDARNAFCATFPAESAFIAGEKG